MIATTSSPVCLVSVCKALKWCKAVMLDPKYAQMAIMVLSTTLLTGSGTLLYAAMSATDRVSIELTKLTAKTMQIEGVASDLLNRMESSRNSYYQMAIDIARCQENVEMLKRRSKWSQSEE